jgi:Flp pilus assembly protein TadD
VERSVKFYLLLSLAIFIGCSSTPERSSRSDGLIDLNKSPKSKQTSAINQALPPVVESSDERGSQESKVQNSQDELDRAIQKQDDRSIAISARQVLIQSPHDVRALNALALYHFRRGELTTAKTLFNKAISLNDQNSTLYSNLGMVFQADKDEIEAIKAYRQALKIDPFNSLAAANVGSYYAQERDYGKAQVALEIAVEKGQRDWRTLNNYGVTLMALGKYQFAETQLKKAAELQSQNTAVLLNYAILLVDHLGKPAEGLEVISKIRFIGPSPDIRKKISELENKAKSLK